MINVSVLLSSYNGVDYIKEQIDSILQQEVNSFGLTLYVRDDGSKDNTKIILKKYYMSEAQLVFGDNVGVVASFLELLKSVREVDYIAFADQDDYWMPNKINKAIGKLTNYQNVPGLYCSRLDVVNSKLEHLFYSSIPNKKLELQNALVENIATGCTIVINKKAIELLRNNMPDPNNVVMHDWWFYLVISAFGKVVYDTESTILYRQHGNNVEGMKTGLAKIKTKLKNLSTPPKYIKISRQVTEFKRCYYHFFSDEQKKLIDDFLLITSGSNILLKLKFVLSGKVYRQTRSENLLFLLSLLLNRI